LASQSRNISEPISHFVLKNERKNSSPKGFSSASALRRQTRAAQRA
jgi:hypothetical protein